MRRRRLILAVVVIVLLGLFLVVGFPLIRDLFTPPITGLPTAANPGNSLQARFTQTAQARASAGPAATRTPESTTQ